MTIHEVIDPVRGCGKRKPGGLYLVAGTNYSACCGLPLPLTVCPCCGQGIKFFRGFGWIDPGKLFEGVTCKNQVGTPFNCIVKNLPAKMGLMWVGEMFYTPGEFTTEAARHGISKRIASIPNDFEIGKTWLALAHKKAVGPMFPNNPLTAEYLPGVFMFFKPSKIEYVIEGNETTEFLERLEKKGVTLVRVVGHEGEQIQLPNT